MPGMKRADCTSGKHCVIGMHHMKSLDASISVLHRVYGARGRHNGSIQLVWCTHLPDLTSQVGPVPGMKRADYIGTYFLYALAPLIYLLFHRDLLLSGLFLFAVLPVTCYLSMMVLRLSPFYHLS